MQDNLKYEKRLYIEGFKLICGIDEAGRGPLAGPVVAAAVIFPQNMKLNGVTDSKKLSAKKRCELYKIIKEESLAFGIGIASVSEIDRLNILKANFLAMQRAVDLLKLKPDFLLIDGRDAPFADFLCKAIVKGDLKSHSIGAASILAKVTRDNIMADYAKKYPEYGFEKNQGYGTKKHLEAIRKLGRTPIHRITFKLKEEKLEQKILF